MAATILIVEDTRLLLRMYAERLTADGHRVLSADNGLEALSVLRSETPNLILLDLVMPRMSGLEIIEYLKKDERLARIPILILSNLGQDADIQRGIELGATDYLIKNDTSLPDLSDKIHRLLHLDATRAAQRSYHVLLRDREGDADRLIADAALTRRFWCPSCEVELSLELIPKANKSGWYDAHFACPLCGKQY